MDGVTKELLNYGAVGLIALLALVAVIALFKQLIAQRETAESFKKVVEHNTSAFTGMYESNKLVGENVERMAKSIEFMSDRHADIVKALIAKIGS